MAFSFHSSFFERKEQNALPARPLLFIACTLNEILLMSFHSVCFFLSFFSSIADDFRIHKKQNEKEKNSKRTNRKERVSCSCTTHKRIVSFEYVEFIFVLVFSSWVHVRAKINQNPNQEQKVFPRGNFLHCSNSSLLICR